MTKIKQKVILSDAVSLIKAQILLRDTDFVLIEARAVRFCINYARMQFNGFL